MSMGALQAKVSTGKLLITSRGTMSAECCCVACNGCDPHLKANYVVTLASLACDSSHNGAYDIAYDGNCIWTSEGADPGITLAWDAGASKWVLDVIKSGGGAYACQWEHAGDTCDPTQPYSLDTSASDTCCTGGTVVVS